MQSAPTGTPDHQETSPQGGPERHRAKTVFLASLGSGLEYFDFVIYAVFAQQIGATFFPTGNPAAGLLAALAVFAAGYLARPIGGIVISHYGDRIGRKLMLRISIGGTAGSAFALCLLPGFETLGLAATIVFVALRLLQGLLLGGEIPGALTLVSEAMPKRRGLACSCVVMIVTIGLLLGHLANWIITNILPPDDVLSFGWRIGFLVAGILSLVGFILRRQLLESPAMPAVHKEHLKIPILEVMRHHHRNVVGGFLIVSLGAATSSILLLYINSYAADVLQLAPDRVSTATITGALLFALPIPLTGWLSDRSGRPRQIALCGAVGLLLFCIPLFSWLTVSPPALMPVMIILPFLSALAYGPVPGLLTRLFPADIRFSGVAMSFNLSFALFGGLTPLISASLVETFSTPLAPAYVLTVCVALGALGLFLVKTLEGET